MSGINGRRNAGRHSERLVQAFLEPLEERLFLSHTWELTTNEVSLPGVNDYLTGICVADFNGDGRKDIAAGTEGGSLVVALGNGDGTFQTPTLYATGSGPYSVVAADVNGDGKPDLVTANYNSDTISVFINKGNGTFKSGVTYSTGEEPVDIATGDFNGDGKADLAVANWWDDTISIFMGSADGTLTSGSNLNTGYYDPTCVIAADVNHDGRQDLIVTDEYDGEFQVFMGGGNGAFGTPVSYSTSPFSSPVAVAAGDLNGDGNVDLAVADYDSDVVEVWTGSVGGNYTSGGYYDTASSPTGVVIADMNGDGKQDLATVSYGGGVSLLLGNGNGTFNAQTNYDAGAYSSDIVAADFNGDGKKELVVAGSWEGTVDVLSGGYTNSPPVAVNDNLSVTQNTVGNVLGVRANDSDADGDALVVSAVTTPSHGTATLSGGGVIYTPTYGYVGSDMFTYTISDGWGGTDTATVHLTVNAIATPPVVTTTASDLAYTTSTGAKAIDTGLTVADVTIPNLDLIGATVSVTGNYAGGEDVLTFTNQSGITGVWDAGAGVLTLSGMTTMAAYQAALRSVKYNDSALSPSLLTRTVTFAVNDGASTDNWSSATRLIDMTYGFMDLAGVFGTTWTLPVAVVSGKALTGYASVVVSNIGNIPLPAGQQVNLQVVARDTTNSSNPDITLVTLSNQSVSALGANKSVTFLPYVNRAAGLPTDDYQIFTNIIPVQALAESNTANNQVSQTASGATETVVSAAPFVDLSAGFGATLKLPAADTSGDGKLISVPVVVRNVGNVALPVGQKINIEIDAFDGATTTPIKTLVAQSVSSLGPSASATFTASVTLPPGLPAGTYNLVAVADSSGLLTGDTNPANNTVTTSGAIAVAYGYVDLTGMFGTTYTLPPTIVDGKALTGSLSVVVKNLGNVALPTGQLVNIVVLAHDTTNPANPDIALATLSNQSVSAVAANGGTKSFTATINRAAGLPSDTYQILANIAPVGNLTESDATNDQASQNALGATKTILSAPPFYDLTAQFGTTLKLPAADISGDNKAITVPVVVKNLGNVPVASGDKINIEIDAFDGTTTTPIKTLTAQSVSLLGANGGSATFTASVTLPLGLASGTYNVVAVVDSSNLVTESNESNNTVTSSGTIAVTKGFVDLTATFGATLNLPAADISGDGKRMTVPVVVKNLGNAPVPAGQKINIEIDAFDGATTTPIKTLVAQSVSSLKAGGSATFTATGVTLPVGLAAGTYHLVAVVDSSNLLAESDETNNTVTSAGTMAVTMGYVDLTGAFGSTMTLPASDTSGDGKQMTVPVVVKNIGNVALPAGQKINIEIDAFDGATTTPIKTLTAQSVSSLNAGGSATFTATGVKLPPGLAAGSYNLVAVVDSSNLVTGDASRANNTVTSPGTIAVAYGYVDLAGVFGTTWTLPSAATAGKALTGYVSVVVSNLGNVALPTGQTVNIVVVAHDTTNPANPDVPLATLANQSVSALAGGATKQFSAYVNRAAGLSADTYQVQAVIAPVQPLTESDPNNNVVLLTALGSPKNIVVS